MLADSRYLYTRKNMMEIEIRKIQILNSVIPPVMEAIFSLKPSESPTNTSIQILRATESTNLSN